MSKSLNPYKVVKSTFYMTKLIGLAPFNLENPDKIYIEATWSLIVLSILSSCAVYAVYINATEITERNGVITEISNVLVEYLNVFNLNLCILCAFFHRKKILDVFVEINDIDEECIRLNLRKELLQSYLCNRRYQFIGRIAVNFFVVLIYTLEIIIALQTEQIFTFGNIFCHDVPIMISLYVDMQLFALVYMLKQRFALLNCEIEKYGNYINRMDVFDTQANFLNVDVLEKTLTNIRMLHLHISSVCEKVNEAYSPQLLTMTLQAFVSLIANMFYWARELIAGQLTLSTESICYSCSIIFFGVIQLIFMVVLCSKTITEASKVGYLLHRVRTYPYKLEVQVTNFTSQLVHCKVEFTACKIFELDEGLLLGVVGAITTYLIIVIQFELTTKEM